MNGFTTSLVQKIGCSKISQRKQFHSSISVSRAVNRTRGIGSNIGLLNKAIVDNGSVMRNLDVKNVNSLERNP